MPTYNILFYIRRNKINTNRQIPIYCRVTVDGKRAEFSINRWVSPDKWHSGLSRVRGNKEDARSINNHIEKIRIKLNDIHTQLLKENKNISARTIVNIFSGSADKKMSLIELFKYHNQLVKEKIGIDFAKATYIRYETTLNHISRFLLHQYRIQDILLMELNYKIITDFEHYLKTVHGCNHNTSIKYIRNFRKIIHMAVANEWLEKDPFHKFKSKLKDVERIFLTAEELQAMEEKEISIPRLERVRDAFVFCCYTGLSYIDLKTLSQDDIIMGIDGKEWISLNRAKTGVRSNIPLLPKPLQIIDKYREDPECAFTKLLMPIKSNQKMNAFLKEIAVLCGINKDLHWHTSRHTFATTVTLTNNVPIETVSSMLGHKNIRTTQIYAKVVEKKVSNDMAALEDKLSTRKMKTGQTSS